MYIKLLGADASDKNLGQIETVALDSTTLEIMRNMTRFSIYSPVSYELDKFIKTLKANDIWDSIQLLYFPWLAGQVDELLYNPQGVPLSFVGEGAETNLFANEGIIYLKAGTYSEGVDAIEAQMPNYDIQGKFISIGNVSDSGTPTIISATNLNGNSIVSVGATFKGVINGTYNFNYGWGARRYGPTNLACTFLVPSSGFPTGLRVTTSEHNIIDSVSIEGDSQIMPSSFVFNTLNLGRYITTQVQTDVSLTGESNASYILGSTTLTEGKARILDVALNNLMQFMRTLRQD